MTTGRGDEGHPVTPWSKHWISSSIFLPSQTEHDSHSLFHAASLGLWGVHDRTALLSQAVSHTLADPKAQFLIYDRWSTEISRSAPAGTKPVSKPPESIHCGLCVHLV